MPRIKCSVAFIKSRSSISHTLFLQQGNVDNEDTDAPCWSMPGGLALEEKGEETASCCCHKDNEPIEIPDDESETNDLDFLRQMAFYLVRDVPTVTDSKVSIDTKRIYMSGHGNGCMLAHAMAAHHSDLVAAVACMAGVAITALPNTYEPVPTWTVAGALDEVIPTGGSRLPSGKLKFPGQQVGFQYQADSHACSNVYNNSTAIHDMDLPEYPLSGTMHVQTAFGCINGAIVQHLTLVTAGHLVYKGVAEVYPFNAADTTVDTTSMAWGFMTSFASTHEPMLEQEIDLDEIKDLLQEEEESEKEEEAKQVKIDVPPPPQDEDADEMSSPGQGLRGPGISLQEEQESKQEEEKIDIPPPPQDDEEDEMSSPWQGLRGPGISLQEEPESEKEEEKPVKISIPPPPQDEEEDEMSSPWQGQRGPGISEEQALFS